VLGKIPGFENFLPRQAVAAVALSAGIVYRSLNWYWAGNPTSLQH